MRPRTNVFRLVSEGEKSSFDTRGTTARSFGRRRPAQTKVVFYEVEDVFMYARIVAAADGNVNARA